MTRIDKINFLKGLQSGTKSINDLVPTSFIVKLYKQDEDNEDYLLEFGCNAGITPERISKADYKNRKADYSITLNI